jgi:hypothetical protein
MKGMDMPDFSLIDMGIEYVKKNFPELNLGEPTEKTEKSAKWIVPFIEGDIEYVLERNVKYHCGFIFGYFGGKFPNGFELRRFYV